MLRVRLLGTLTLEIDGMPVEPPSSRGARLVLAMLALDHRPHSRESLAAGLWPDGLQSSARASLRTALTQLRGALGREPERFLHTSRERVALAGPDRVWTDVAELERALDAGDAQAALALWSGELLTGLDEDWIYDRHEELRGRLCEALGAAADEAEARGDPDAALRLTRRHAALEPLAEEPQRELIRRLARVGDRAAALVTYDKLVRRLRDQLHTMPSPATRELAATLRSGMPASARDIVADATTTDARADLIGPAEIGLALPRAPTALTHRDQALGRHRGESIPANGPARLRFNLPPVVASFAGREAELNAIDEALSITDRAVITQAITGLGGVGKSQLAARYVQRRADDYDLVAWIRAEDGGVADLAELAIKLGAARDELSPHELAQLALDWLGNGELRWLLVLDNVVSPQQLERCCPRGGRGRVLVTSRDRAVRELGRLLTVDVFDEETATAYLIEHARRPNDRNAARRLAVALGQLPLALSHAAAYCQSGTSFTEYLALLGGLPARELFDSNPVLSHAQTVASTWRTSIRAANDSAPLADDILAMAAHLAPDTIPKSLLAGIIDGATPRSRKRMSDALNALARFSLATVDDDSVSLHRLLQKTIRDDEAVRGDRRGALRALTALQRAFPTTVWLPQEWPLCEQLLPHVLALADALRDPREAGVELVDLLNRACRYLHYAEPGQRDLATSQVIVAHAERILGATHPATLVARNDLAAAYHWAGRTATAIAIFEPLLGHHERILGLEHPATLTVRNNLAYMYRRNGQPGDAVSILEALLPDRRRLLGARHRQTLTTANNLARAYNDIGRTAEAIAILEPLVADHDEILGPEDPSTLLTRHNLALAYISDRRLGDAIAILEPLCAHVERILGKDHPYSLRTMHSLGVAYLEADRRGAAIAIFEPLLEASERILGSGHPDTLATRERCAAARRADITFRGRS
jgi:DNA-binding SARP family transcriptional activator